MQDRPLVNFGELHLVSHALQACLPIMSLEMQIKKETCTALGFPQRHHSEFFCALQTYMGSCEWPQNAMAICLAIEAKKGAKSPFYPYLKVLPDPPPSLWLLKTKALKDRLTKLGESPSGPAPRVSCPSDFICILPRNAQVVLHSAVWVPSLLRV